MKAFYAKYGITVLDHPLYSPDLAPCDFFVSLGQIGLRFDSVEAVKAKTTDIVQKLTEADFQHCFFQ